MFQYDNKNVIMTKIKAIDSLLPDYLENGNDNIPEITISILGVSIVIPFNADTYDETIDYLLKQIKRKGAKENEIQS